MIITTHIKEETTIIIIITTITITNILMTITPIKTIVTLDIKKKENISNY